VPDLARAILISIGIFVLASTAVYGHTGFAFLTTAMQLAAVAIILTATWDRVDALAERTFAGGSVVAIVVASVAGVLIFLACRAWIVALLLRPLDAGTSGAASFARALRIDARLIWLVGQLFLPIACGIVAVGVASRGKFVSAIGWLLLVATAALAPDLRAPAALVSTPLCWPLLAALAWSVARVSNRKAAFVYGVAGAALVRVAGHYVAAAHAADPRSVVGTTGLLLRVGAGSLAAAVHFVVVGVVLIFGWRAVARGRRPLPWIALALFATDMTSRAPFDGIPLDALALFAFAAVAETEWLKTRRASALWLASVGAALFVVAAISPVTIERDLSIDVGARDARPFLYSGFADDEGDERTFAWVDGRQAEILLPRRSWRPALIEIVCQPNLPTGASTQQMSASLNGLVLGTTDLHVGWQTVSLDAPPRAWNIGANVLTLSFSSAVSPLEAGLSADARKLSVALDRVTVRTK